MGQLFVQDCDNPQRLPTTRDGGLIGTPNAIVIVRTQSRRSFSRSTTEQEQVCLQAFQLFDSAYNPSRESSLTISLSSQTRPVRAAHSADRLHPFFSFHASNLNRISKCTGLREFALS